MVARLMILVTAISSFTLVFVQISTVSFVFKHYLFCRSVCLISYFASQSMAYVE